MTTRHGGASWTHHGPERGLPNVAVYDVQVNRKVVVAYTHGRGAFRAPLYLMDVFVGEN